MLAAVEEKDILLDSGSDVRNVDVEAHAAPDLFVEREEVLETLE